jgi:hypothetical protein
MKTRWVLGGIFAFLLASRLAHSRIVWVEEAYPAAAAIQVMDFGKTLYRDIWFDKPGGAAYLYLLWGAHTGVVQRVAGAIFIFLCCLLLFRFGRALWGEREGQIAAGLLGFYLTFGIPAAVMALAPDLVLLLPHILAVYLAWRGKALFAGLVAGMGLWINTKALFVAASALLFLTPGAEWVRFFAGLILGLAPQVGWLTAQGALGDYWDQVWRWGAMYARDTFVEHPITYGLRQTLNWCGFQLTLVIGCFLFLKKANWRFGGWLILSLIPVALGLRFFPRYYFQLLPACALIAARAFTQSGRAGRIAMTAALAIPLIRFGPRYVTLTSDLISGRPHQWMDLALADDSVRVSEVLPSSGATLFVWGYRPDIYVHTRLNAATRFLDSQPLSGVIADRHLISPQVSAPEWAQRFRNVPAQSRPPDFIVDGLGLLNPQLAIPPAWLGGGYTRIAITGKSIVYRRTTVQ